MMSLLEKLDLEMTPAREIAPQGHRYQKPLQTEPGQQISNEVAEDLNQILTLIQGYAERMMMMHWQEPVLHPDLEVLIENARRAAAVVRRANQPVPTNVPSVSWGLAADGDIHGLPESESESDCEQQNRIF